MSDPSTDPVPSPPDPQPDFFKRCCNAVFCWRTARGLLIGLGVLITLIAIAVTIENIRGKRAWDRYEAELKAAGESLDPKDIAAAPVPDDQNFAMTPLLRPLLDYTLAPDEDGGKPIWADEAAKDHLDTLRLPEIGERQFSDRRRGLLTDLQHWQAMIRADTNHVIPAEKLSPQIAYPPDPEAPDMHLFGYDTNFAAQEILLGLERFSHELAELHRAAKLPYAQFPVHLQEGFGALLAHMGVLRNFAAISELKAVAHLASKEPAEALAELRLIQRYADSVRPEPVLISGLIQLAIREQVLRLTWEGIARKVWRDEDLIEIEKLLRTVDFIADYERAVRGERALAISSLWGQRNRLGHVSGNSSNPTESIFAMAPAGFYYQNLVNLGRMYQEIALPCADAKQHRFFLDKSESGQRMLKERVGGFSPYHLLARILFPAWDRAVERYAAAQVDAELARIACALELHRRKHGRLPESLNELTPAFLTEVPMDPTNGESYHYQVNGQNFILYSPGANAADDAGTLAWEKDGSKRPDFSEGDWVWTSKVASESE
jgi:hypothetical protein